MSSEFSFGKNLLSINDADTLPYNTLVTEQGDFIFTDDQVTIKTSSDLDMNIVPLSSLQIPKPVEGEVPDCSTLVQLYKN